ncbi:MAG: hypothetical protein ABSA47_03490 [Verrucomicrobiota bacterium]|jgi:hypothetical protein
MIEIAIAIGVIAFALVAIIGVLPFGLNVQKETHQDIIVSQDGLFILEAIRNGGPTSSNGVRSLDFLTNYVEQIAITNGTIGKVYGPPFSSGKQILGLLSSPTSTVTQVRMRSLTGSALEQNGANTNVAFRYYVNVQIIPFVTSREATTNGYLPNALYDISLKYSWPVLSTGLAGPGRAHFRSMVSGLLMPVTNDETLYWYMQPNTYSITNSL